MDESNPSDSCTQEQLDEFNAWMDEFGTDNDEVPFEEVSPELLKEISGNIDESQLQKVVNDMLRNDYGNSGSKKYVLSLHKYHVLPFPENVLEELTSRWVSKCFKRSNLYARYSVEHWKMIWAKQYHIRRHEKKRDNPEIVVRRANEKFYVLSESDYKHLHKNDIEDLYLMCKNGKLGLESYHQKVNLTASTFIFPGIERKKLLTITSKLVVGLIYENSKKEKRVIILKEILKFRDATLIRVLKLVEVQSGCKARICRPKARRCTCRVHSEENVQDRLKHHDQIRR
ncbi:hypothetical protein Tco_1026711 [Tanacetum coccineum]